MISGVDPLFQMQQGRERQEVLGQFLTPSHVADFMASLFDVLPASVRMIDAGAGAGALIAAFVRRACMEGSGVESIHATAYELDPLILPALRETLATCESLCQKSGITFTTSIHPTDFILDMAEKLSGDLFRGAPPSFNVAIVNPPYKKITTNSHERLALCAVELETSNLYTGFLGLLAHLLEDQGQLVAITPRSFCNGPYFRPFRLRFLERMKIQRLHVFDSRDNTFRDDGVLQENIVFHTIRASVQSPTVVVSSSSGNSGAAMTAKRFPFTEIVHPNDPERFIHVPADAEHATATAMLSKLPATLASLGVTVSTGRVVDFRLKDALRLAPVTGTVPLLYPCHFATLEAMGCALLRTDVSQHELDQLVGHYLHGIEQIQSN
jgi:adenine-specific DNA-methyltransferase